MRRSTRVLLTAALLAGSAVAVAGSASAGIDAPDTIDNLLIVEGANADTVIETVMAELLVVTGDSLGADVFATLPACAPEPVVTGIAFAERFRSCQPPQSQYLLTVDVVPDGYVMEIDCNGSPRSLVTIDGREGARIDVGFVQGAQFCDIYLLPPSTLSTVVFVAGADADGGEFDVDALLGDVTVEAFEEPGGSQVASPAICETEVTQVDGVYDGSERIPVLQSSDGAPYDGYLVSECELPDGDYFLGVDGLPAGLTLVDHNCEDDVNDPLPEERLDEDPAGSSASFFTIDGPLALCDVFFRFDRQTFSVDIEVTNDDGGGTATGADFTIEVFDTAGELVASGMDPEPGSGNASLEITLGVGDYRFGVSGPAGYAASATVTVVDLATEPIPGDDAAFTISNDQSVAAVIDVDDQVTTSVAPTTMPPTTVTPTTMAPTTMPPTSETPTTAAPTTAAPTTEAPTTTAEITAELPATGSNTTLSLWALALVLIGGGAFLAARRRLVS